MPPPPPGARGLIWIHWCQVPDVELEQHGPNGVYIPSIEVVPPTLYLSVLRIRSREEQMPIPHIKSF